MTIQQATEQVASLRAAYASADDYSAPVWLARFEDAEAFLERLLIDASVGQPVEYEIRKAGKNWHCVSEIDAEAFVTRKAATLFRDNMRVMVSLPFPERLSRAKALSIKVDATALRARANARARSDAMRSIGMTKTRYGWE